MTPAQAEKIKRLARQLAHLAECTGLDPMLRYRSEDKLQELLAAVADATTKPKH